MGEIMKQTARRTLIPEDFEVSDSIMDMVAERGWPDPRAELHKFKDHHIAQGTLMANWEAAFRTWLNKAVGFGAKPMPKAAAKAEQRQKELALPTEEERQRVLNSVRELANKFNVRRA
jgi:hypothetical protein